MTNIVLLVEDVIQRAITQTALLSINNLSGRALFIIMRKCKADSGHKLEPF